MSERLVIRYGSPKGRKSLSQVSVGDHSLLCSCVINAPWTVHHQAACATQGGHLNDTESYLGRNEVANETSALENSLSPP